MKLNISAFVVALLFSCSCFAQVIETEDGIPLEPKQLGIEVNGEYETAPDEHRISIPLIFQYGISKRFTLEADPLVITSFNLKGDTTETGIGDIEFTAFFQVLAEKKKFPALSFAAQAKLPTAQNRYIGTGKTDFTGLFITGKTIGKFSTYLNFGATIIGKPTDIPVNNILNYSGAVIYTSSRESIVFGEVYGNTSAVKHLADAGGTLPSQSIAENSEFSGGEVVFSLGYGYHLQSGILLSAEASYSNSSSLLFRLGLLWESGEKKTRTMLLPEKVMLAPERLLRHKKN